MTGQLVVVTGATGSGKSTTCRKLVITADELWLHVGVDQFLGQMVPPQYVDGGARCDEGVHMAPDDPADPAGAAHLDLGELGPSMLRAFHEMVAAAVRAGQRVVVDHILTLDPPILADCVARWHDLPVLLVGLRPPTGTRDDRIDARLAQGFAGYSEEQLRAANDATKRVSAFMEHQIFGHDDFDLVLDNTELRPRLVVDAIRERLAEGPGTAIGELAARLGTDAPFG